MQLLIVRHAIAEEREIFARTGKADALRPLTRQGRDRMRRAALGLARVLPAPDLVATSPYLRAVETAEIVAKAYGKLVPVKVGQLASGAGRQRLLDWLHRRREKRIAIVGHEPDLGRFAGWLLSGEPKAFMELKKGQTCLLEFSSKPKPGNARLLWSLKPSQLRRLGGR